MEHSPPLFFNTGPSPLARLLIFSVLSLLLLAADARFNYLTTLRQIAAVIIYPIQRLANTPSGIARRAGEFFVTQSYLRRENERMTQEHLANAAQLQQFRALEAENANLRGLLGVREQLKIKQTLAEVLYAARDPFSRKIVVDRGASDEIKPGQPVIDSVGVIGQVTRVYPWLSEVTLITDKDHLVPVLNPRNGLRAVLGGTGNDGVLELRFIPLNADFQNGDRLVTSGIDGVYPPGLPVAEVLNVERNPALLFARITCKPVAGVSSHRQVLIVSAGQQPPERPVEEEKQPKPKKARRGGS
jgi:rod shape-determining protein MreC